MLFLIVVIAILIPIGILIAILRVIGIAMLPAPCEKCKKRTKRIIVSSEVIKEEKVSKIEELKRRDKNGQVIGTRESRIYGVRQTLNVTYRCPECDYVFTKVETKDIY